MKRSMIFAMLWLALSFLPGQAQTRQPLTEKECWELFPRANRYHIEQQKDGTFFCEAWHSGHEEDADELLGYVFLKTVTHHDTQKEFLIGVAPNATIAKIKWRKSEAAEDEFLAQFKGKSLSSNFEMAKTPEDLLPVPAKLNLEKSKSSYVPETTSL